MCVTIWITHSRISLPILYKLIHKCFGSLLCHVYNESYCKWSNTLICYIWTIFHQQKIIFIDSNIHSVIIYLIGVTVYHFDVSNLDWGLVQKIGSICCVLCHINWRLTWMGITLLSVSNDEIDTLLYHCLECYKQEAIFLCIISIFNILIHL